MLVCVSFMDEERNKSAGDYLKLTLFEGKILRQISQKMILILKLLNCLSVFFTTLCDKTPFYD